MDTQAPSGLTAAPIKVNKNGSITKVDNGYIFYAGAGTKVAYTFDELVAHLNDFFEKTAEGSVWPLIAILLGITSNS